MKFEGSITYKHTDGQQYTFEDVYTVDPAVHTDDSARSYIRNDLKLVAGGGYESIPAGRIINLTIIRS